jgi:hypothetical protein
MRGGAASRAGDVRAPGRTPAVWLLAAATVLTALGMTAKAFRGDGTSINAWMFMEAELSHEAAKWTERAAISVAAAAAVIALAWPRWFLLAPIAVYLLLESLAGRHMGGYAFSELTPAAHALRYLTPLALALIAVHAKSASTRSNAAPVSLEHDVPGWSRKSAEWLLRLGLAAVFLIHGYEAIRLHPEFIDLIISSGHNLLGMRIEEAQAASALKVIGAVDIAVAALVLIRRWRVLLGWMALWGLVTALSRMTAYGWGAYPEVLLRATHFMVPLALLRAFFGDSHAPAPRSRDPVNTSRQ